MLIRCRNSFSTGSLHSRYMHSIFICFGVLFKQQPSLLHCCVVIDSQYMRWSMFASGLFTQWALSPAFCWPASQALFSHPTIGFLSTMVTLTINNTRYYIRSMLFNFPSSKKGARTALNEVLWVCLDFVLNFKKTDAKEKSRRFLIKVSFM